ncbi:MAG: DUF1996 domain-containing protein [Acidobacteria bacterium]|nr:DUF1996 domain-containing protein [Acidobacteriota bacterium]
MRGSAVVAASVALLALVSCGNDADTADQHRHAHTHLDTSDGKPDRVIAGPQGGRGQFVVECGFSHVGPDDPIVHPGQPGASHEHVFFGNTTTDAASTLVSLDAGGTTCDQQLDRAAYWAPALYDGTTMVTPVKSTAYYRAGLDVDPVGVQPYPGGLMMIAGNAAAAAEQPLEVVAWTCGAGIERSALPPECPPGRNLRLILTFPDCWDGVHLDTPNHIDHVAYSSGGVCPAAHPVAVPQLQFSVEYDHTGPIDGLALASGGLLSGHADFVNAWDADKLAGEVRLCLHRNVVCGVTSGKTTS